MNINEIIEDKRKYITITEEKVENVKPNYITIYIVYNNIILCDMYYQ